MGNDTTRKSREAELRRQERQERKAKAIRLRCQGMRVAVIAEILSVTPVTVYGWLNRRTIPSHIPAHETKGSSEPEKETPEVGMPRQESDSAPTKPVLPTTSEEWQELVDAVAVPDIDTPVTTAELYSTLEKLIPFAKAEIDWLISYTEDVPEDSNQVEDVELAREGSLALARAMKLVAAK